MEEKKNYGYLLGQITALVESLLPEFEGSSIAKKGFVSKVFENPSKLDCWLVESEKLELESLPPESKSDFMESVGELFRMQENGHKRMTADDKNGYWIGYYHQKAKDAIQLTRKRIGLQIKALREAKGITQRELEKRSGLTHNHISRIEAGKYNVSIDSLAKISAALDVEISVFDK